MKKIKKISIEKINKDENNFLNNLNKIGYNKIKSSRLIDNKRFLTKSFQRRFRQNLVNGIIDKECLLISKELFKTY